VVSTPLHADQESTGIPGPAATGRRGRRLRHLRQSIALSYPTTVQRLRFDALTVELLRVADVDALLDRLPKIQFRPDERLPYWADLWPSALALARYLWRRADLRALRVLELGCGMGLVGIVASRQGAAVTLTDYEADALAFARYNVLQNGCQQAIVRHLDWHAPRLTETYGRLIASDILYERDNFLPLLRLLQTALAPEGQFIIAEPNRPVARHFFRLLRDQGFRYERVAEAVEVGGERHDVSIYIGGLNSHPHGLPAEHVAST
jgi:predicted nicotinamide N-methyase